MGPKGIPNPNTCLGFLQALPSMAAVSSWRLWYLTAVTPPMLH